MEWHINLFRWLFVVVIIVQFCPSALNETFSFEDTLQVSSERIVQDLIKKYLDFEPHQFFESFVGDANEESREFVHIESIAEKAVSGRYIQWRNERIGQQGYTFGLKSDSLDVFGSDLQKKSSIGLSETSVAMASFTRWNDAKSRPEVILVVTTAKPSITVFRLEEGVVQQINGEWPLHSQISSIEATYVDHSTQIVLIPQDPNGSVDIYNIEVNGDSAQVWFHQRFETSSANVAVYQAGDDSFIASADNDFIQIYRFDSIAGKYIHYKSAPIQSASRKLVAFSLHYRQLLASVPQSGEAVEFLHFDGNEFRHASFGHVEAYDLKAIALENLRDERVLVTRAKSGELKFLSYAKNGNMEHFQEPLICRLRSCTFHGDLSNVADLLTNNGALLLMPTDSTEETDVLARVLTVAASVQETPSPGYLQSLDLLQTFTTLTGKFLRWEKVVRATQAILSDALSVTQSNIVTGEWAVREITAKQVAITRNQAASDRNFTHGIDRAFEDFTFVSSRWEEDDFQINLDETVMTLQQLHQRANEISEMLNDAIPLNSEVVHVVTAKQAVSSTINCKALEATSIQVKTVNRQASLSDFLSNIVSKSSSVRVGSLIFSSPLSVNHLQTVSLFDIPVENIALLSERNEFKCPIQFQSPLSVLGNVHCTAVNGLIFREEIIDISNMNGVKLVDGLVAFKQAHVSGPVDSVIVQQAVFDKLFLKSTSQKITVPFAIASAVVQSARVEELNGESFREKVGHIVSSNFVGTIFGQKTVHNEVKCDSTSIAKTLNGVIFPDGFIFANQKKITLSGKKAFNTLTAAKVSVAGQIQGISTNNLVLRDGFATLKKAWTFSDPVQFLGDVVIRRTINGISTDQLKHHDTLDLQRLSYTPNADVEFRQPVVFRTLNIESLVNGKSFEELFGGILSFDGATVNINGLTKFQKSLRIQSLNVNTGRVNGLELTNFFTLNSPQTITGNLIFEASIKFSSLYALSKFDSIDLAQLFADAFLLSKSRMVTSEFAFEDVACGSSMKVMNEINHFGTDFSSYVAVVSGRKEQVFTIPTSFESIEAKSFKTENFHQEPAKTLGGLNIEAWFDRFLRLSGNEMIPHAVEIDGNVKALGGFVSRKINGFTISHLRSGVLRSDVSDQMFTGAVKTSGLIQIKQGSVNFANKVSGHDLDEIFSNAFPLNSHISEVIHSPWMFERIEVQSLQVDGKVGGVYLGLLNADVVRKGDSFIAVHGHKSFILDFEVHRSMNTKLVNFEDMFSNVFTLSTAQTITGPITFTRDQAIEDTLRTSGTVNAISLNELASTYSFNSDTSTHILKYNVEAESLSSERLAVKQLIQNKQFLEYVQRNIVRTSQTDINIIGSKTFKSVVNVKGPISAITLNNQALTREKSIARISDQQLNFKHAVNFLGEVNAPRVTVHHGNVVFSTLDRIDFNRLVSQALHLNSKDALGSVRFASIVLRANMEKVQTLNGFPISDIATTHTTQHLGNIDAKSVVFTGDNVNIQGTVLGHDLNEMYQNTFMTHSITEQFNQGALDFRGNVIVKGNFRCLGDRLTNVVTTNSDHEIQAPVEFEHIIRVKHLQTNNLVNGHRIEEIASHALTKGANEDITAFWNFEHGVTFKSNVEGQGHIDGHDIRELINETKEKAADTEMLVRNAQTKFEAKCEALNLLSNVLEKSPCRLHSIDTHQSILTRRTAEKVVMLRSLAALLLLAVDGTGEASTYRWNSDTEQFVTHSETLRLGSIRVLRSITFGTFSVLAYASQESSLSPSSHGLKIRVLGEGGQFLPSELLRSGSFIDIQFIQHENSEGIQMALCAVDSDDKLFIFEWDADQRKFTQVIQTQLKGPVQQIAVANHLGGIAILHHCDSSVHLSHYSWSEKSFKSLRESQFLANSDSAMSLFEDEGNIFALLEGRDSVAQPSCNLQVFQLNPDVNIMQKLRASNANVMTPFKFCGTNFVASFSKSFGATIYKFQGISGFTVFNEYPIRIANGHDMVVFKEFLKDFGSNVPFIAVSTAKSIEIFHSNVIGHQLSSGLKIRCGG